MEKIRLVYLGILFVLLTACGNNSSSKNYGPIILGDSASIVTETDPQYLTNNIDDVRPRKIETSEMPVAEKPKDTVATTVQTTPKPAATKPQENGLQLPFASFGLLITGIDADVPQNTNWTKARSSSMTLKKGKLQGQLIKATEGTITKVQQRIQTVVMLQYSNDKDYKLSSLPVYTSQWQTLSVRNGTYTIEGLDNKDLDYNNKFNSKLFSRAAQKLARDLKLNRRDEQKLISSIGKVSRPNQAPCSIALQSVVWKISGKDAKGKTVEKEVRIDLPL